MSRTSTTASASTSRHVGVVGGALQREREQAEHDAGRGQREVDDPRRRVDGGCDRMRIEAILSARERAVLIPKAQAGCSSRPPSMTPIGRCARRGS